MKYYKTFKITPADPWACKAGDNFEVMQEDFYDVDYDYERGHIANEFFFYASSIIEAQDMINDLIYESIASERFTAEDFKLSAFEAFTIECEIFTTTLKHEILQLFKSVFS